MPSPRILVTRSPQQASELADHLRALGAEPVLIPTIETVDPTTFAPLDAALNERNTFHWLLFTSANAVETFHRRSSALKRTNSSVSKRKSSSVLKGTGFSPSIPPATKGGASAPVATSAQPRIAAIGHATARALDALGLPPDLIPPQAVAESLAESLLPHARQADGSPTRFLLLRAEEAREHLPDTLRAARADVTIAPAYRTVTPAGSLDALRELFRDPAHFPDAITFTSSSTARNLFALVDAAGLALPETVTRASIGPITSATLRELGYPAHTEAPEANVASLAENLVKYLRLRKCGGPSLRSG